MIRDHADMNQNEHITPPRRFRPTSIISNPSTTSSHSNLNNYPVGLIKVYQSDEEFSNDSFSITSRKLNDARSIISQVDPAHVHNFSTTSSLSDTNDVSYDTAPTIDDDSLFNLWFQTPEKERESLVIPSGGLERPRYVLDKVVESFRSEKGAFLTSDIFLNQKIYQQPETIINGSVKISIIQEINTLLRKFHGEFHDLSKFNTLEPTLAYYKKLMDAFDVLHVEASHSPACTNDSLSSTSSINNQDVKPYKTVSKESTISSKKSNQSLAETEKPKKRNSLLLDKFKGKMKNRKRHSLNNWENHTSSDHLTPPNHDIRTHSRSISVSSTQTQASSRSAKDQATIQEYLESIESLHLTLNMIYDQHISEQSETYSKLSLVIEFLSQYIVKFLMSDITSLSLKYIQQVVKDLV